MKSKDDKLDEGSDQERELYAYALSLFTLHKFVSFLKIYKKKIG
jgi:hypothetical protein